MPYDINRFSHYMAHFMMWDFFHFCLFCAIRASGNIRFNHGFEVFNIGCGPRSTLKPDAKQRALISTEGHNQR